MRAQDESLRVMFSTRGKLELWCGETAVSHRTIGTLHLREGNLMTADPLAELDRRTVDEAIPPGDYPVKAIVAATPMGERVAGVLLALTDREPLRWDASPTGSFDPTSVGILATPSFTVESGYACWGDERAVARWLDRFESAERADLERGMREALARNERGGWSHAEIAPGADEGGNVLVASAGMGRGMYWSFSGYDEGGALACVITDFRLEDHVEVARRAEPERRARGWWKFWR